TNVSVGPVFGELLAAQFADIWEKLGRPAEFKVVEQGAHDGVFAADTLRALKRNHCHCFASARYVIVEPFPMLRERQRQTLAELGDKISWVESVGDLEPFTGIHFS